ncbi:TIGR02206 family membrane protein [Cohnella caldifontis]|uniref:YwaF family protein n=1 Tax=Cohnella caldifontis TaxID=3027471 RepID=UPI0023ED212C|nr:TIGR02206 family membrane protein [Cohnella sp. YIM B05605]
MAFQPFSPAHWAAIGFTAVVSAAVILFRARLRGPRADRWARRTLAGLLIVSEISLYAWYSVSHGWGLFALPFQLCTITLWVSAAALLTGRKALYEISFFLGILGAVQALLTPNLEQTFPQFRYFHFFIAHAAIIASGLYVTAAAGFRPALGSAFRAWGWLNAFAAAAGIVNAATGENFMFLARKPDTPSLLDLLAPWPWYILELEAVALLLILLLWLIVRSADRLFAKKAASGSKATL